MYKPERNFAEFETGTVTLSVVNPEKMGIGDFTSNRNHLALQVEDVEAARATLEERGVTFMGDTFDTGVCHMAFLADPRRKHADAAPPVRAAGAGERLLAPLREHFAAAVGRDHEGAATGGLGLPSHG
jgi:hypothetical protein